jgi:hypothetical protein
MCMCMCICVYVVGTACVRRDRTARSGFHRCCAEWKWWGVFFFILFGRSFICGGVARWLRCFPGRWLYVASGGLLPIYLWARSMVRIYPMLLMDTDRPACSRCCMYYFKKPIFVCARRALMPAGAKESPVQNASASLASPVSQRRGPSWDFLGRKNVVPGAEFVCVLSIMQSTYTCAP